MKKQIIIFIAGMCLLLSACGAKVPEKDAAGNAWNKDWTAVGDVMGVEPMEGWTVQRSEDVLAAEGMYYTVWTAGDAVNYTNADGDTVTTHPAEIHLVAAQANQSGDEQLQAALWKQMTDERYPDNKKTAQQYAGQDFEVCTYASASESSPVFHYASATGTREDWAIRVDVVALDNSEYDPEEILTDFLNRCHYAA